MIKKLTLIGLFFTNIAFSQNYQTTEEIDNACAQLGFMADEEAEIAVDRILEQIGLFRNFVLQQCPDINNAVAKNIKTSTGDVMRYILYDNDFFNRINDKAANDWAAISILAHEIGHHLNGHSLNNKGSNHKYELEADYFSGLSLAKMGATLEQAQSAINTLKYEKATRTHPAKKDRLLQIEKGWSFANDIENQEEEEEVVSKNIIEDFPVYPGCSGTNSELKKCFNLSLRNHLVSNFNAGIANEIGLTSRCIKKEKEYNETTNEYTEKCTKYQPIKIHSMFKVSKNGDVVFIGARAPHTELQNEAERIINLLPKMIPGKLKGKNVSVPFSLPIAFIIQ
ncbi:hypothetical protein Q4512_07215 [Oceanihabitans sp. 2_MG-2023]|uniref:hypothetical protein n=1 Tax=Oceanihabitans sp. 2_MG-2023 TaxID=3062661 RepID=UPI0026E3C0BF|nr:hypothetical protein [Oceanihabitans sp. 2_MG-2023]MDO6596699.1 hypothetical protein [Oceanihabitans sp. 2_MG-2023]